MTQTSVRLALTLGDPAGIGPEIVLKALADPEIQLLAQITVIGHRSVLLKTYDSLPTGSEWSHQDPTQISILEPSDLKSQSQIRTGQGDAASGAASFAYLKLGIERTLAGEFQGIVTAPIAKFAWKQAGHEFPGQTEMLAQFSQSTRYGMLFVGRSPFTGWQLRVLLATTHIPLRQVPQILTADLMRWKLDLLVDSLRRDFGLNDPVIAVSGLNPHSGEAGQLGWEEIEWLTPLLKTYRRARILGPIPPDTLWTQPARAWLTGGPAGADAYLALYHDQGLIPVKMLAFDQAVNTTIGLPFVRTSPDHGTAFDIAGQGLARAESLKAAIRLAAELAEIRAKLAGYPQTTDR